MKTQASLILTTVHGPEVGRKQVLKVKMVELRPKLFRVTQQEDNKLTVIDIDLIVVVVWVQSHCYLLLKRQLMGTRKMVSLKAGEVIPLSS